MEKIIVTIPRKHSQEREYTIQCILGCILGVPYQLVYGEEGYTDFYCGKTIRVIDSFWDSNNNDCYSVPRLPVVKFGKNRYCAEEDIPILYGNDIIDITDSIITCHIDIIASSFFLLSRWEEYVIEKKDAHQRFSIFDSVAYKYGFHRRPVVNEYAEMLWNMFQDSGFQMKRNNHFCVQLTHDIDFLVLPNKIKTIVRDFAREIIKNKRFYYAVKTLIRALFKDPYDRFDFFMKMSERVGVKSHFFFMSADPLINDYSNVNYLHRQKFNNVIKNIINKGHFIGFHPSYFAFDDVTIWASEYNELQSTVPIKIIEGRQHYLRVNLPKSLPIWECYLEIDSSLGFADSDGFRCGTGNTFPLYDFTNKKESNVLEMPLVVMDTTLAFYLNLSVEDAKKRLVQYIDIAYKYSMPVTFLFHNNFYGSKWDGWEQLYEEILDYYLFKKNEAK